MLRAMPEVDRRVLAQLAKQKQQAEAQQILEIGEELALLERQRRR